MMNRILLALLVTSPGCALFEKARDVVEGVTDPNVVVGLVTRLDPPTSDLVDLESLGLEAGIAATVFLADAREVADLENAPVAGATVQLRGCDQNIELEDGGDGSYTLLPGTPIDPCTGSLSLRRTDAEKPTVAPLTIPDAPDFNVPERWTAGEPLTLPLASAGFKSALVVVIDASTGDVTFDNRPEGITEYYQFLKGTGDLEDLTIPGSAFREDTVHGIIVTGFITTPNTELTEANTVLSVVAGGNGTVFGVSTLPEDTDAD